MPYMRKKDTQYSQKGSSEKFPKGSCSTACESDSLKNGSDATGKNSTLVQPWESIEARFYYAQNRVMFILRGLPGSGKSTLAKNISLLYKSCSSICCADDFRYKADSEIKASDENRNEALMLCKKKAGRQCSLGRPVVN